MVEGLLNRVLKRKDASLTSYEGEFSRENFAEYARMCVQVGWKIAEFIQDADKPVTILLPSRGALPIFIGAMLALERDKSLSELNLAPRISLPPLNCFNYVRPSAGGNSDINTLIFPFTADVNVTKLVPAGEVDAFTDQIRRFGARASGEFLKPVGQRDAREFRLFLKFLEVVEGRRGMLDFFASFPQIQTLVAIDTVISGRASWTIFDEWAKMGLDVEEGSDIIKKILIIDEDGKKLKPNYRRYVDGCASCFRVPRILTEDRGAALEGVVAVVYPELIMGAKAREDIYPAGYPLLGSWHSIPERFQARYLSIFNGFLETIGMAIARDEKGFEDARHNFCYELRSSAILATKDEATREDLQIPHRVQRIEETSSHVIQVFFPKDVQAHVLTELSLKMK